MRKIRVNTGLDFLWTLYLGENTVDWAYYDLTLEMTKPSHAKEIIDFTVDGSVLRFNYKPNQCGQYIISAYLNRYKPDEAILDNKIFEAVRWTWNTSNSDESLAVETLELEGNININTGGGSSSGDIDLSDYYTKEEIDNRFETVINVEDLETYNFASESWVTANYQPKGDYQPAGNYLTSIPSEYVTESELETRLENVGGNVDLSDYYTKGEVDKKIEDAAVGDVDLTSYATKDWAAANYQPKGDYQPAGNYLTSIPSEYITESELETRLENVSGNVDLTDYYTKDEVDKKIDDVAVGDVDLTGYATEDWTAANYQPKGDYLTSIPAQYVTEKELANRGYITEEEVDAKGFITYIPAQYVTEAELAKKKYVTQDDLSFGDFNLDGYYTKFEADEIFVQKGEVNMDDYATIYQLAMKQDKLVSGTNIKTVNGESIIGEGDIKFDEFTNKQEALVSGVNIKTINGQSILGEGDIMITGGDTPDMTNYVTNTELNNKGYITSIPAEYITEEELNGRNYASVNSVDGKQDKLVAGQNIKTINGKSILGGGNLVISGGSSDVDLTGYAKESWVTANYQPKGDYQPAGNYLTSIPSEYITESELETRLENVGGDVDLTGYATEDWTAANYQPKGNYLTSIPSEYVTETELALKKYVTGDDLDKYVTEDKLNDKGYLTSIPSEYITESELETRLEEILPGENADLIPTLIINAETGQYNNKTIVPTIFSRLENNKPCHIVVYMPETADGLLPNTYVNVVNYQFLSNLSNNDALTVWVDIIGDGFYMIQMLRDVSKYTTAAVSKYSESWTTSIKNLETRIKALENIINQQS